MQLAYIGDGPPFFVIGKWPKPLIVFSNQPVFTVDALFVFGSRPLTVLEKRACQLIERSGRPSVRVGAVNLRVNRRHLTNVLFIRDFRAGEEKRYLAWFGGRPRSSYTRIDCGLYDEIETLALGEQPVPLTYLRGDGIPVETTTKVITTKTHRSEEYVELADHGWIRMDRITRLNHRDVNTESKF
jgi:transcriptional antiterminator Rof (Rho-off)